MSRVSNTLSGSGISGDFRSAADRPKNCGKPKSTTLTIRLTLEERESLEAEAQSAPLGRHIKDQLFRTKRRGMGIAERQALARVLRALAESNLALDLDAVYRASIAGEIHLDDGLTACVAAACEDVSAMRKDLIKALGLRPK